MSSVNYLREMLEKKTNENLNDRSMLGEKDI